MKMEIVPMLRWLFWFNLWTIVFRNGGQGLMPVKQYYKTWTGALHFTRKTHSDVRSPIECASLCYDDSGADQRCKAFWYYSLEKKCDSYTQGDNWEPYPGVEIFQYNLKSQACPTTFNIVNVNGKQFSVYFCNLELIYVEARAHCNSLGGYLLEFDSLDEYEAVKQVMKNEDPWSYYLFVGANDLANEGAWVTDREIVPFSNDSWIWGFDQPNNLDGDEHCAGLNIEDNYTIYDRGCTNTNAFLCEKDFP